MFTYRISANSFCGNYSFLNLALFTVTFDLYFITLNSCRGNYSREETIQGRKLFAEIRYLDNYFLAQHFFIQSTLEISGSFMGSQKLLRVGNLFSNLFILLFIYNCIQVNFFFYFYVSKPSEDFFFFHFLYDSSICR